MRIDIHATTLDGKAILSLRMNGRQVAQIDHSSATPAAAMIDALAQAIAAIAREEAKRAA